MHPARNHLLPPDREAYRRASHPRGRVIVIAPTRAACETIELALDVRVATLLERDGIVGLPPTTGVTTSAPDFAGSLGVDEAGVILEPIERRTVLPDLDAKDAYGLIETIGEGACRIVASGAGHVLAAG